MPTSSTDARPRIAACFAAGLILVLLPGPATPQSAQPAQPQDHAHSGVRTVLSTGTTVTGEPIRYPSGAPAHLTAVEITLQPGQQTGWHTHPVPLFGYVLDGELTVDYGPKGVRVYRKGEGLAEAMNEAHNGRNLTGRPVTILAVFAGMESVPNSVAAVPPARP